MQSAAHVMAIVALALVSAGAQAPPAAKTPPAGQTPPATKAPPPAQTSPAPAVPAGQAPQTRPAPVRRPEPKPGQAFVRDVSGRPLVGVKIVMTGPTTLEVATDANGSASLGVMPEGTYRLRFEQDGFLTFEREVTVKAGQPAEVYAALRIAPPAAPAPPPAAPPPAPPPAPAPSVSSAPSGPAVFVSIPDFLDKNYIRREPLKESVLGCLGNSTTRLLQLHEAIAEHTHSDMDEMLYVVAGEGAVRIKGESTVVSAGSLTIVPKGLPHGIERRGKNPLMVLSTLAGAPCRAPEPVQRAATGKK